MGLGHCYISMSCVHAREPPWKGGGGAEGRFRESVQVTAICKRSGQKTGQAGMLGVVSLVMLGVVSLVVGGLTAAEWRLHATLPDFMHHCGV